MTVKQLKELLDQVEDDSIPVLLEGGPDHRWRRAPSSEFDYYPLHFATVENVGRQTDGRVFVWFEWRDKEGAGAPVKGLVLSP